MNQTDENDDKIQLTEKLSPGRLLWVNDQIRSINNCSPGWCVIKKNLLFTLSELMESIVEPTYSCSISNSMNSIYLAFP